MSGFFDMTLHSQKWSYYKLYIMIMYWLYIIIPCVGVLSTEELYDGMAAGNAEAEQEGARTIKNILVVIKSARVTVSYTN